MTKKLSSIEKLKKMLLVRGVEKLKIIGFINVTIDNILTDEVYQLYFLNFLNTLPISKSDDEIMVINEFKSNITKLFNLLKQVNNKGKTL